MPMAEKAND